MKPSVIPATLVDPDPDQPRRSMDQVELQQLAENIQQLGQLQPVIVYRVGERYHLADGHRRFAALQLTQADSISALVLSEKPAPDRLLMTQLAANCHRADLKPTELADSLQRLRELKGWSNSEIARQLSLSKARVTQVLSYLKLPERVQQMLDDGSLPGSTAYAISRAPDAATKQQMLQDAVKGKLKRDDASKRMKQKRSSAAMIRSAFVLPGAGVVMTTSERPDLEGIICVAQALIKECRRAARQGIDVSTLERVLRDQHNSTELVTSGSSMTQGDHNGEQ